MPGAFPTVSKPYAGFVGIKNQGSTVGTFASAQQRNIPISRAAPSNPFNNNYPGVVNSSSYPSLKVAGKKTPGASIRTFIMPYDSVGLTGWSDADIFNALLFTLDSDKNTNKVALGFKDDRASGAFSGVRTWDWSRCTEIEFSGTAAGGPVGVRLEFLSRWGESEMPNATALPDGETTPATTTWVTPGAANVGGVSNISLYDWGSPATMEYIRSWTLTLMRGQGFAAYCDGTLYPKDVVSTMFTGVLTVEMSPPAGTYITSSGGTATLRMSTNKAATTGRFKIDMTMELDSEVYPHDISLGNVTRTYTLVNTATGGNPVVISAY